MLRCGCVLPRPFVEIVRRKLRRTGLSRQEQPRGRTDKFSAPFEPGSCRRELCNASRSRSTRRGVFSCRAQEDG
jgi:hypothetical protein